METKFVNPSELVAELDENRAVDQVTAAYCAGLHKMLRRAVDTLGIRLHPTQGLGAMLKGLEWFGSYPPESHQPEAAWKDDPERAVRFFGNFEQVKRVAIALTLAPHIPGDSRRFRLLKDNFNRLENPGSKALDLFFELDIAHRLLKRGIPVAFEEPDLVVGLSGMDFGVACKRPRKRSTVAENILKGAKQVRRHGRGLVVLNLELVLLPDEDPHPRNPIFHAPDWAKFQELQTVIDNVAAECQRKMGDAFAKPEYELWGVLFCALATAVLDDAKDGQPAGVFQWFRKPVSPPTQPGTAELLDEMVFGDQETVIAYSSPRLWKALDESLLVPLPKLAPG